MSQQGSNNEGGTSGGDVTEIVADTGSAMPVAGIIDMFGGTGITTSASGNTVIITATGSGLKWNIVTSATNPNQIVVENGYICAGSSMVTFLLPLAPNVGDPFEIISMTALFQITENGSQSIRVGSQITTAGSGTLTSNTVGDDVSIIYVGSNQFMARAPQGTLTTA